jgi:hypothetical protein
MSNRYVGRVVDAQRALADRVANTVAAALEGKSADVTPLAKAE